MRVTIISRPRGAIGGMWLEVLQVGQTYNLKTEIARVLVREGWALEERRWGERRRTPRPDSPGRRHEDLHKEGN